MRMFGGATNRLIVVAIGLLVVAGLATWLLPLAMSSGAAPGLEGKTWHLVSIGGVPAVPGSQATIKFEAGKISGSTGVNQFGGAYRATGSTITLEDIASTLMASTDPALNDQEQKLLGVLQRQLSYRVSGNQLELISAGGTLVYTA
jgi:heat shock protein HslJ